MPQFNFQPIYSKYAGNTLAQEAAIVDKEQQKYDLGEQYVDTYEKFSKAMEAMPDKTSEAAVNNLRKKGLDDIKGFVDKGNYNDIYNKIRSSALNLQSEYAPHAQNLKTYREGLPAKLKDEAEWGDLAKLDIQKSISDYEKSGGVQINPATGLATNYFKFNSLGKYYDIPDELIKRLDKVTIDKIKQETGLTKYDNLKDVSTTIARETRLFETLKKYGKEIIEQTPHLKHVINVESDLDSWQLNNSKGSQEGTTRLSDFSNIYNENMDKNVKTYQDEIKKLEERAKYKASIKANNSSDLKTIQLYKEELEGIKNKKINDKDKENPEVIKNKLYESKVESATNLVSGMLKVNNSSIDYKYVTDDLRKKLIFDGIDKKVDDAYNIVANTGMESYTPDKIVASYELVSNDYKNVNETFNSALTKEGKTIGVTTPQGKEKLEKVLDAFNKEGISAGGTGENDITKAKAILDANFKFDWSKHRVEDVINKVTNLAILKFKKDEIKTSYETLETNLNNIVDDKTALKVFKDAGYKKYNKEGKVIPENQYSKDDIIKIKKLIAASYNPDTPITMLKNLASGFINNTIETGEWSLPSEIVKYGEQKLFNNIKTSMNKNKVVLKNLDENVTAWENPEKKSSLNKMNTALQEVFSNNNADLNLKTTQGVNIQEAVNNEIIKTTDNEKIKDFSTRKLTHVSLGNGIINLSYEVDGGKKVNIHADIDDENGANIKTLATSTFKNIIKSDDKQQVKDDAAIVLGKLDISKQDRLFLTNAFDVKNSNPFTINVGNGILMKVIPNTDNTIDVDIPTLDNKGKKIGNGIPVIDNQGNITDFKYKFYKSNLGDLYKYIGYIKASK